MLTEHCQCLCVLRGTPQFVRMLACREPYHLPTVLLFQKRHLLEANVLLSWKAKSDLHMFYFYFIYFIFFKWNDSRLYIFLSFQLELRDITIYIVIVINCHNTIQYAVLNVSCISSVLVEHWPTACFIIKRAKLVLFNLIYCNTVCQVLNKSTTEIFLKM